MKKITIGSIILIAAFLMQLNPVWSQKTVDTDKVNLTVSPSPPLAPDALALRYDSGENSNSYGITGGGTFYWAAYWPASTMASYSSLNIYSVDVYIGDVGGTETLYIWDQGTSATEPGTVLTSQSFTPVGHSWVHIDLSSPVAISGNDIWIGVEVSGQPAGETPAGGDSGPANTGLGDMYSTDGVTFGSSGLGYNWNISANLDDPGCLSPSNLTAYNTTTTSATLAWTDNAGASSFDIELVLHNTPPTGSPSVAGGNPFVISQLTPNTIYDYYVRAYCSPWSGPYSFSTACYKINAFPYTETFDNNQTAGSYTGCTLDGSVPLWYCWSNNSSDDFDWNVQSGPTPTANTGPVDDISTGGKYLYTESSGCNGSTAYVVGPEFNFTSLSIPGISFYYHMDGTEMGIMSLEVSTDQGTLWNELWTKNGIQGSSWKKQTIALFGYEGNTSVMFRWKGITGAGETSDMALDQVIVGESTEGTVEGYVTTVGTNVPLENALVSIGSYTDLTDNTGYYNIENIPLGTYTVTCEFTDYVTQQIEDYIVVPGISTLDFEMPYGNSPTSMDASGSNGQVDLSWGQPLPIEGEIKYDNGVVGAWGTLGTPQNSQQMFYVRFTAPEAGFINQVAVFNKSDASVNWNTIRVCPETGIVPDLNNPYETFTGVNVNSLEGEWELLGLTSPFAVTAGQDFYVVTQWNDGSTVGPKVGIDIDAPYAGRSAYTNDGGSNWVIQLETDWIMRAYYTTAKGEGLLLTTIPQTKAKDISLPEFNVADKEQQKMAGLLQKTYFAKSYQVPLIVSVNPKDNKALTGYNVYKGTDPASLSFLIATDIATTEYVDNAVINGTKYYYEVRCVYDEGYSAASNLVSAIPLSVTSGFPFSTDFEADNGGFSGIGDWQWGEPVFVNGPDAANSGQNVWGTILDGDYNPQQTSMLLQAFDLSGGIDITLKFAKWFDMVQGSDYCQVAVDQNNDDVYEILKTYTGSETFWEDAYVKIPAEYTSDYTKLAFIFSSNTGATAPGFYLDDLSLEDYIPPKMTVNPLFFNETIAVEGIKKEHLSIGNDGGLSVDYTAEITEYGKNSDADILFENFDAGIPQGAGEWTIVDGGEPTYTWEGVSDYNGETIDGTPFAFVSSLDAGNVVMDEYLESPFFDGTGYQTVLLEFDQVFASVMASANIEVFDGYSWHWVAGFMESQGSFGAPDHQVIDISQYLYSSTLKVRFKYYSPGNDYYWAIDNVKISDFSLPSGWLTLNGGQTASGAVLPGNTDGIIVGFDATGIPVGTYYTNIEVTSNDPDYPFQQIPVSMTVVDVISPESWLGGYSSNWNEQENWSLGLIPSSSIDVIIPASVQNYPIFNGTLTLGTDCGNITMEGSAILSVTGDLIIGPGTSFACGNLDTIRIEGDWTNNGTFIYGTSTVDFYGSNPAVIQNSSGTETFGDLLISKENETVTTNCNLDVSENLTINPGAYFTNENTINVTGDMTLKGDASAKASFIDNGTLTVTGSTYVNSYYTEGRWHFISSPVSNAVSDVFTGIYLKEHDEATNLYLLASPALDNPLTPGKGYEIWSTIGDYAATYTGGSLNQGNFSITVSATDANSSTNIGDGEGWNFVGNPYSSAITLGSENDDPGYTWTNLNSFVYFWADTYDNGNPVWAIWDRVDDGLGQNGGSATVPTMQGFFVKASNFSPALTIPNVARRHSPQTNYKNTNSDYNLVRLEISGNNYFDEYILRTMENSTMGFESEFDAYKLNNGEEAAHIYGTAGDVEVCINTIPEIYDGLIIPVQAKIGASGVYTIFGKEMNLLNDITVYLEDVQSGSIIQFEGGDEYQFAAEEPEIYNFNLLFEGTNNIGDVDVSGLNIYSFDRTVYVQSTDLTDVDVNVYDILGKQVKSISTKGNALTKLIIDNGIGYYLVKVRTNKNVITKKVFIN